MDLIDGGAAQFLQCRAPLKPSRTEGCIGVQDIGFSAQQNHVVAIGMSLP